MSSLQGIVSSGKSAACCGTIQSKTTYWEAELPCNQKEAQNLKIALEKTDPPETWVKCEVCFGTEHANTTFLPAGLLLHCQSQHSEVYFYDVPAHEGGLSDAELSEDDELPEKEELPQYVAMSKKENLFEKDLMEERLVKEVLPGKEIAVAAAATQQSNAESVSTHQGKEDLAEAACIKYNQKKLAKKGRHTSDITTGCLGQEECKVIPDVAYMMTNGLDLNFFECLICCKRYNSRRRHALDGLGVYKEYRFAYHADLINHLSTHHINQESKNAVKEHGEILQIQRWQGLGPRNCSVLHSGPFQYPSQSAHSACNIKAQQEAIKESKNKENSFRISHMDLSIFRAAHTGFDSLAKAAENLVKHAIVRQNGGGEEGVLVCLYIAVFLLSPSTLSSVVFCRFRVLY